MELIKEDNIVFIVKDEQRISSYHESRREAFELACPELAVQVNGLTV